jgi:hypothetical protein
MQGCIDVRICEGYQTVCGLFDLLGFGVVCWRGAGVWCVTVGLRFGLGGCWLGVVGG